MLRFDIEGKTLEQRKELLKLLAEVAMKEQKTIDVSPGTETQERNAEGNNESTGRNQEESGAKSEPDDNDPS